MSWQRRLTRAAMALVIVALAGLAVGWKLLVKPAQTEPVTADAVVVFAGGKGERLDMALTLMEDNVAEKLIINRGVDYWHPGAADAIYEICDNGRSDFEVICVVAEPDSTKGEAATFSDYAAKNDLRSLVYVTTTYHLHRAGTWMKRCFDGELQAVGANADTRMFNYARESAALGQTWFLDRSC